MAATVPPPYGPEGRSPWMDVDWREHQRWVLVGGQPINVIELGEGPPIVFVHGLGGCWQNWLEQLPVFAATHRVIALDLPGFGASPLPREPISIAGYGRTVAALLGELDVDAACVVGNSMGGFIALELAIREPQLVERLVLVSAAGLSIEHQRREPDLTIARRTLAVSAWLAAHSEQVARRRRLRKLALLVAAAHPDRLPAPLAYEQLRGSGTAGFLPALQALLDYPIRDRVPEIACPTLVLWGRQDRLVPVADADEFERLIPDSRKVIWEDTGHVSMLERPARFNAELAAFLAEEPGEQVGDVAAATPDAAV